MLRFFTAGESHGKCLVGILEGMVAGLKIDVEKINFDLARRQKGYGRGGRMQIEEDKVEILSGLRKGETIGSPIALSIVNKDFKIDKLAPVYNVRPGHADLAGVIKYARQDARDILERSSARETAMRVAIGSIAKQFLAHAGIDVVSHVIGIGQCVVDEPARYDEIKEFADDSEVRCCDKDAETDMKNEIDTAKENGTTVGGVFEVVVHGVPVGLGSYAQWDRKLNARLAYAVMGIQAIKGVEVGPAFDNSRKFGHEVHDEIMYDKSRGYYRLTNNAGGIEGGMSNGEDIVIRAAMKPIPTLINGLKTVNIQNKSEVKAGVERSDYCAVPAASVVGEAVVAVEIANALLEKFGGDSLGELLGRLGS
ncbi:chorismate synthase [bacterium]|nr:chorismate synthase [bacterium]